MIDYIKKVETLYLKEIYGDLYMELIDIDVSPLWIEGGKILTNLLSFCRNLSDPENLFIEFLLYMERSITKFLLNEGSFCKFIFGI